MKKAVLIVVAAVLSLTAAIAEPQQFRDVQWITVTTGSTAEDTEDQKWLQADLFTLFPRDDGLIVTYKGAKTHVPWCAIDAGRCMAIGGVKKMRKYWSKWDDR